MSVNPVNVRLGHLAVLPITGTEGPRLTHVRLTPEAGLTRYDESYADVAGLQPIARGRLRRRRGRGKPSGCWPSDGRVGKSPTRPSPSC